MDILLTHGYFLHQDRHERKIMKPYPPLGILYASAHLKQMGFSVGVYDTTFSDLASFKEYLRRERPAVVGLYCNLTTRGPVLEMVKLCRKAGCLTVLGGPEPANGADVLVVGEGELTLGELLPHLLRHGASQLDRISGLAYRGEQGQIIRTPARPHIQNLDAQPLPDREAIDIEKYVDVWRQNHGMGAVSLITSRGCPYTCTWCSHSVFGYSHRARSPVHVADEVEWLLERYRPDLLWYADDVFTISPRWLFQYAAELKRREIRVPFETISREDRLDNETVSCLADMGCHRLWLGSESGSQPILDAMQRRTSAPRLREMVRLLQRHGIQAGLFLMLGYEGEDDSDIEATMEHLRNASPDVFTLTVAYPIKGTPYHDEVSSRVIQQKPWASGTDRDVKIDGRHSRRFYQFAIRWISGEFALHKQEAAAQPVQGTARLKALANSRIRRLGMQLTRHQVER